MEDPGVCYFAVDLHHDLVFFILDDAVCNLEDGKGIVSHQRVNKSLVCAIVLPRSPKTFIKLAHKLLHFSLLLMTGF